MSKQLVVAEKPSVGADIAKVLHCTKRQDGYMEGDNYVVTWAVGHLIGLKYPEEHDEKYKQWKLADLPFYFSTRESLKVLPGTAKQFKIIKSLIQRQDIESIINAGDAGREGLLIQEWIYRMAGNKKKIEVLWISSFTEDAIRKKFAGGLEANSKFRGLLSEAEARAEGDNMMGINYSRALTLLVNKEKTVLSYGRCQTPLLNLIIKRDREINAFQSEPYYNVELTYGKGFKGMLIDAEHKVINFGERAKAEEVLNQCAGSNAVVKSCMSEEKKNMAPYLMSLTVLQKKMGAQYGYAPDRTLEIAQNLYEKHKILSYPRTDSRFLSSDLYGEMKEHLACCDFLPYGQYIKKLDMQEMVPDQRYFNDLKVTDHYALIPTVNPDMESIYASLTKDERNVFDAVVRSFIAIFFPVYSYSITNIFTEINGNLFLSTGKTINKLGYKEVLKEDEKEDKEDTEEKQILPELAEGSKLAVDSQAVLDKKTQPPKRYTVSSIVSLMEANMIGTPATMGEIVKKLQKRKYIALENGKYYGTEFGSSFIDIIPDRLKGPDLTKRFEEELRRVNEGETSKEAFLQELKKTITENIEIFKEMHLDERIVVKAPVEIICPACKKGRVMQGAKSFYCSEYKSGCQFTIWKTIAGKNLSENQVNRLITDGKTGIIKGFNGKKGKFDARLILNDGKVAFNFDH